MGNSEGKETTRKIRETPPPIVEAVEIEMIIWQVVDRIWGDEENLLRERSQR